MPFEILLGLRYTKAKRRNHFISFISLISMLGIALGVTALIVVLSVMNGFQSELRHKILGVASHIQITGMDGYNRLANWQEVITQSKTHSQVLAAAPFVQSQAMITANLGGNDEVKGVIIRVVLPNLESQVSTFDNSLLKNLIAGEFNIILGYDLAQSLNANIGDKITLIAPQGSATPAGLLPRIKRFKVVDIFKIGMYEYDSALALIHINDAQKLFQYENNSVSGVRLKINDIFDAPKVMRELIQNNYLSANAWLSDWTMSHANFFRAVQIEKTMMFIILSLIVAVAAFNLVSTLVMAVTDKESDIAILRTLGAKKSSILIIFIIQGAITGFVGLALGVLGGVSLALNIDVVVPFIENLLGVQFLSKEVYYISDLPSELHWDDVFGVVIIAFILSLLATIYPSWKASKVNPAAALRYE